MSAAPSLEYSLAKAACRLGLQQGYPEPAVAEAVLLGDRQSRLDPEAVGVRHTAGREVVLRVLLVVPVESG
jgi:hypothetical protein